MRVGGDSPGGAAWCSGSYRPAVTRISRNSPGTRMRVRPGTAVHDHDTRHPGSRLRQSSVLWLTVTLFRYRLAGTGFLSPCERPVQVTAAGTVTEICTTRNF